MAITRRNLLLGAAWMGLLGASPLRAGETARLSGRAYGTTWSIRIVGTGPAPATLDGIGAILAEIDEEMSPFRPDSALSGFNAAPAGWHASGPGLLAVTGEALRIATLTGGAFDPSVGPSVGRYGFGPITGERTGTYRGLSIRPGAIGKTEAGLSLDLCGIAKGHALDRVGRHLKASGHSDFLIEIGGELLASGSGPEGRPWRLGIEHPETGALYARLAATDIALATSGDRINRYDLAGRRYTHIIDPLTDAPVANSVASVSVLHPSAMTADALATGLMVMGAERGLALAEAEALPVLFLLHGGETLDARASTAFAAYL
ncbi:FAD:protein FMN transferase [Arsenicitalea aurantiaca]|uniref:FAD:protein FMN transferase n=1 Tax=Arsenicitalea aurantiaca TaxID=1783274 RepID=A0A433XK78_9HYPH|nr:FAD:protein FMN transferase [Arsenicitalea aurantiaca]RUT34485.1 FAD:protein FMN transferase [Arsenicitalea aurantiaca]